MEQYGRATATSQFLWLSKHVHRLISQFPKADPSDDVQHAYFLYNPDTDWHPEFEHRVRRQGLRSDFVGISDILDGIVTFMEFLRWHLEGKKRCSVTVSHLIIPASILPNADQRAIGVSGSWYAGHP